MQSTPLLDQLHECLRLGNYTLNTPKNNYF